MGTTQARAAASPTDQRRYELLERSADYFQRYLWGAREARPAREMLAARGLEESALRAYGVGFSPANAHALLRGARKAGFSAGDCVEVGMARTLPSGSQRDAFSGRVTFPVRDGRGRAVGFGARALTAEQRPRYLNTRAGPIFAKGEHLFGAAQATAAAAREGAVVLCEGYLDVIALRQAGMENAVCPMGTAVTHQQHRALQKLAPTLILAPDADPEGLKAALRTGRAAVDAGQHVQVALLPAGADPCDLLRTGGADAVQGALAVLVPFERFEVEQIIAVAEISDAESKDRLIAELRPFIAELPYDPLRDELNELLADRIDIDPANTASYLGVSTYTPPFELSASRPEPSTDASDLVQAAADHQPAALQVQDTANLDEPQKVAEATARQIDASMFAYVEMVVNWIAADDGSREELLEHLRAIAPDIASNSRREELLASISRVGGDPAALALGQPNTAPHSPATVRALVPGRDLGLEQDWGPGL